MLFAVEFDRRHRDRGIRATAVHPGGIQTELGRHMPEGALDGLLSTINEANAAAGKPLHEWKTVPQGAATSVWAAIVAPADEIGGRFCEDCHVAELNEAEGLVGGVKSYALDGESAKALWAKSEEMVGETFPAEIAIA